MIGFPIFSSIIWASSTQCSNSIVLWKKKRIEYNTGGLLFIYCLVSCLFTTWLSVYLSHGLFIYYLVFCLFASWPPVNLLPDLLFIYYLVSCLFTTWSPVYLLPGLLFIYYLASCLFTNWSPVYLLPCLLFIYYLAPCSFTTWPSVYLLATYSPVYLLSGLLFVFYLVSCLFTTWSPVDLPEHSWSYLQYEPWLKLFTLSSPNKFFFLQNLTTGLHSNMWLKILEKFTFPIVQEMNFYAPQNEYF